MFADPAVIAINAVNKSLARVSGPMNGTSEYLLRSATDEYRLVVRNTKRTDKSTGAKFDRHNIELTQTVFPVAPSETATIRKAYVVFENQEGDTLTDPTYVTNGILSFLTAGSNANITKLLNNES